jgi:hypothetical protein
MVIYGIKVVFRVFTKVTMLSLPGSSHNALLFSYAA